MADEEVVYPDPGPEDDEADWSSVGDGISVTIKTTETNVIVEDDKWSSKKGMIYLKAADEATFNQALIEAGWSWEDEYELDINGNPTENLIRQADTNYYTSTYSLDVIGTIYAETGNMLTGEGLETDEPYEYPEMAPIDGWHANLLLHGEELPASLEPFVIEAPSNPHRRFA